MKKIILLICICIVFMGVSINITKGNTKEITVYTTQENGDIELLLENFKSKYPEIKVNVVKGSTGTIIAKLLLEKENPQCDIVWNVATSGLLELDREKILAKYTPKGLEKVDKKFYDSKNDEPTWVGTNLWTGVITVNTKEAEKKGIPIPNSYEDLTKEDYKNEIVMPDPISSGTGYLVVNSWLQNKVEKWEFIDKLNKNIKHYTSSGSAPTKSTAIGEQVIGLSFDKTSLKLEKDTKEIETIFPSDGLPWEIDAMALVNKEEIKEEAKVFYDWALSDEVMELYLKSRTITTNGKVSDDIPKEYKEMLSKNDFHWAAEEKKNICNEWTKRYSERD